MYCTSEIFTNQHLTPAFIYIFIDFATPNQILKDTFYLIQFSWSLLKLIVKYTYHLEASSSQVFIKEYIVIILLDRFALNNECFFLNKLPTLCSFAATYYQYLPQFFYILQKKLPTGFHNPGLQLKSFQNIHLSTN